MSKYHPNPHPYYHPNQAKRGDSGDSGVILENKPSPLQFAVLIGKTCVRVIVVTLCLKLLKRECVLKG